METTENTFIQDIIDALLLTIGAKDATAEAPIRAAHLRYMTLISLAVGWVGGIYRAKSNPNVNIIGLAK
jgi:hypothetical protein